MREKIYIDSNLFIWGYDFPKSNSGKILDIITKSEFDIYISEKVIDELRKYFCTYYNKDIFSEILLLVINISNIVYNDEIKDDFKKWRGKVKGKDLEHIVIIKKFNIPILVSYDRDFNSFSEYMTPKQFVKYLGYKPVDTDY